MSQASPLSQSVEAGDDARWFSEEIQPHEPALRAYLRGRFPTLHDVDDQVQETYARLLQARESGRRQTGRAYLFVIARNAALDLFRRRRAFPVIGLADVESLAVAEDYPTAAETLDRAGDLEVLEAAVNALPDRCREIFILRRLHGCSHRDIAEKFGISEHTVNAHLAQAMIRCRAFLRTRNTAENHRTHANARA
jgi:RNA polymerase sigma factor (sigma-70 family)